MVSYEVPPPLVDFPPTISYKKGSLPFRNCLNFTGTNKPQRVTGSGTQYTYDANGNMTTDDLNINKNIKYDHRNLITELQNGSLTKNDSLIYYTYYRYDESGNRFAKTVYKYTGTDEPTETPEDETESFVWDLYNVEIYSRDVSGREMAIYKNDTLLEYPVYGLDMIGKIKDEEVYFYMKDHLGSVRAVLNASGGIVSAQDYDAWGYLLENRNYDSDDSKFKFTGKERDEESEYDYFGARYYDARVGNFGSVDPLLEKHFDYSPYNYVLRNPLKLVDPDGRQVEIITRTYIPQESSVNPLYIVYHDNRSADYYSDSYRTEQRMTVVPNENTSSNIITSYSSAFGVTIANSLWNPLSVNIAPGKGNLGYPLSTRVSESSVNVLIQGEARETLIPGAPSIDYSVNFYISENSDGTYNVIASGTEDGFPAYEIWARNLKSNGDPVLIYNRENKNVYPEIRNLLPWLGDIEFRKEGVVK